MYQPPVEDELTIDSAPFIRRGVTLIEIMVTTAILAVVGAAFAVLMNVTSKTTVQLEGTGRSVLTSQRIFIHFEKDLYTANEIVAASPDSIVFTVDYSRTPDFNPVGDLDGDTIPNYIDSDMDGDADQYPNAAPGEKWKYGFNLIDDDEDGDGKKDMQIKYLMIGEDLYQDINVNQQGWDLHRRKIATGIRKFELEYFGSKENQLGKNLDVGHDGDPSVQDAGQGDGIIDQIEIDMTRPPLGHGNGSGSLDTPEELQYITSVRVHIELDATAGGGAKPDFELSTEIYPPMLPLKPIQRG